MQVPQPMRLEHENRQASTVQAVMGMMADGTVRPPPPRKVYSLDEAAAAVEDAQQKSAGGTGKVMLGA